MTETQRQFINRLHLLIVTNVINTCDQFYNYQDEHYSDMDDESMSFNFAVGNELRFLRTIVSKIFN